MKCLNVISSIMYKPLLVMALSCGGQYDVLSTSGSGERGVNAATLK